MSENIVIDVIPKRAAPTIVASARRKRAVKPGLAMRIVVTASSWRESCHEAATLREVFVAIDEAAQK